MLDGSGIPIAGRSFKVSPMRGGLHPTYTGTVTQTSFEMVTDALGQAEIEMIPIPYFYEIRDTTVPNERTLFYVPWIPNQGDTPLLFRDLVVDQPDEVDKYGMNVVKSMITYLNTMVLHVNQVGSKYTEIQAWYQEIEDAVKALNEWKSQKQYLRMNGYYLTIDRNGQVVTSRNKP